MDDERCILCDEPATNRWITEYGIEYLCAECDRHADHPDLSPYL
jgi:hypothetical protein